MNMYYFLQEILAGESELTFHVLMAGKRKSLIWLSFPLVFCHEVNERLIQETQTERQREWSLKRKLIAGKKRIGMKSPMITGNECICCSCCAVFSLIRWTRDKEVERRLRFILRQIFVIEREEKEEYNYAYWLISLVLFNTSLFLHSTERREDK